MRRKWSVKQIIRLIVGSATYRQAPGVQEATFARRQARRLSAEELRDTLLAVSGLLTEKRDGPPVWPDLPPEVLQANPAFLDDNKEKTKGWYPSPVEEQRARSIFLIQKRTVRVPMLETFDLPDNSTSCARRNLSTVAPQALTLLNSALAQQIASALSERVSKSESVLDALYGLTLQRAPSARERAVCEQFLISHTLPELCRVLLNANEFVYVD